MQSWELLAFVIGRVPGRHEAIAAAIGKKSASLVRKHCERPPSPDWPDASGTENPLQKLEKILRAVADAVGPDLAALLVDWLAHTIGWRITKIHMVEMPGDAESLLVEGIRMAAEGGDVQRVIQEIIDDGKIDMKELPPLRLHLGHLLESIERVEKAAVIAAEKARRERSRKPS
jgi:hypothetical protein